MRSKNPEALNNSVDRMIVYGSHARPIVFETNLVTGVTHTLEQRFAPSKDYVAPTEFNPDQPMPFLAEVPITHDKAVELLGLRKITAPLHEITPKRLVLVESQKAS